MDNKPFREQSFGMKSGIIAAAIVIIIVGGTVLLLFLAWAWHAIIGLL